MPTNTGATMAKPKIASPFYDPDTRITIRLPMLEEVGGSAKTDQTEHVNIINDQGVIADVTIQRGINVDVTPSVYLELMKKYPNL
jgi:hypothetical protein